MEDVVYDNFSFVENGCVLTNINHLTLASRDNQLEKRANRNGAVLVQSQLGTKPIYIEGYYTGVDKADAQRMYDVLAAALNRQERPLVVPHAGGTRQYIATPESAPLISQPNGLNRIIFEIGFVVPEGNSRDRQATTIINQVITASSATIPLTVDGSIVARPLITLTYSAVTGGTQKTVSIRNARDFIGLTIERNWVAGDTVAIDSDNFQVYINGELTAPTGRMPTWSPGSGSLYYSDTFTTRSVQILGLHTPGNL